jgi:hypothetical protein
LPSLVTSLQPQFFSTFSTYFSLSYYSTFNCLYLLYLPSTSNTSTRHTLNTFHLSHDAKEAKNACERQEIKGNKDSPRRTTEKKPNLRAGKSKNAKASKVLGHGPKRATTKLNPICTDGLCLPSKVQEVADVFCSVECRKATEDDLR